MIGAAIAEVEVVASCVIFFRGSLEAHWQHILPVWREFSRVAGSSLPLRCAQGAEARWRELPQSEAQLATCFDSVDTVAGCRRLEFVAGSADRASAHLALVDLRPVLGQERASHVRMRFPKETPAGDIVRLVEHCAQRMPLLWGSAGLAFEHVSGPRFTAHGRIAAMAKRYWGVQIQDLSTLQWDALHGMPGVNWLTLIGREFAASKAMDLDDLAAAAAPWVRHGVFFRQAACGLVLAAGPKPLLGDINQHDNLDSYARAAELLQPLMLASHMPLAGALARPEVLAAWLHRFEAPREWLACNIAD